MILKKLMVLLFYFCRIFPVKKDKMIFLNFNGKGFGDSPKYICNELLKKNYSNIYWIVNNYNEFVPNNIKKIKKNPLLYAFHISTSKVIINNTRFPFFVRKRRNQYYIQTWHSTLRLKKIEKDIINNLSDEYIYAAKNDSKMINLMLCGSKHSMNTFKNSFWYDGEIMMSGTPRLDVFFDNKLTKMTYIKIRKKFGGINKKIILYVPTFRKNLNIFEFGNINNLFHETSDYLILLRAHPGSEIEIDLNNNMIDVTDYPDLQELIIACDYFITDYSSCMFDAMIAQKKCVLYTPDLSEYLKSNRELYFDINELPFPCVNNIIELEEKIRNFDEEKYLKKVKLFENEIGLEEHGNASIRVCEKIEEVINSEKV